MRPAVLRPSLTTAVGLAGLAAAMGIGRFAFTPLLPLMQAELGLTLAQGGWLASANYLGYLAGALACLLAAPRPGASARWGLLVVAASTAAMGWSADARLWALLRFAAGAASAFVLVGTSGWALQQLAASRRPELAGWVFGGVGLGITLAGMVGLAAGVFGIGAAVAWQGLGLLALLVAVATWRAFGATPPMAAAAQAGPWRLDRAAVTLILSYGVFGVGYIVSATFIPAVARSLAANPAVFGWAWPLFGLAAFVSTVAASAWWPRLPPRRLAALALGLMAAGVLAPALWMGLPTLLFSALAVGGTFMVVTMAAMQEARRIAGAAATRLIAGMTAAFAVGQVLGPLLVGSAASAASAIVVPSYVSAALLALGALALAGKAGSAPQG